MSRSPNKNKTVLVVAAHPDDEVLGVGGTIARHAQNGDDCNVLILATGVTSREINNNPPAVVQLMASAENSSQILGYKKMRFAGFPDQELDTWPILGIIKEIEHYIQVIGPDIIYTHHYGDLNKDHQITHQAVLTACRPVGRYTVNEIYAFETVSSTEWNFGSQTNAFNPNTFVNIKDTIKAKLKALKCYHAEMRPWPHPRSYKNILTTARKWGSTVGYDYAEAFELIRKCER